MANDIALDIWQRPGPFPADPNGSFPTLHNWKPVRFGFDIRLSGSVRNHPRFPDGEIITSPLREIACDRSWAKTINTLYLLGEQASAKSAADESLPPLPPLLRVLLAEDWPQASRVACDAMLPHRLLLDQQANADFAEIRLNADAMPVSEGQRRAAAIFARIADGAMPYSVVEAWRALAAETSSPDTCGPTAAAGAAAYDRRYAKASEDATAKLLSCSLAGWRSLANEYRRPLSDAEPDQFKAAKTLGEMSTRNEEDSKKEESTEREAVGFVKSAGLDAPPKPEPARPGLVVIREIGGNTLTVIGREARNEFRKIIGATMPLAETPNLSEARRVLAAEFPHCIPAIDAILGDLMGRSTIRWRPALFVGLPGCGKSHLANRIPQILGMPEPHRFDAAGSSDNAFGGTPRRWSSGEPSIPLEAVRRSGVANPCLILDEVEKCGTSRVSGRFSDSVLPFLETTTSRVYPDPYIEAPCDLSQVNYIATANNELDLPAPLRDRFRLLRIPEPTPELLPALAPTLVKEITADRGIDPAWATATPLSGDEMEIASRLWPGGSIRRLRSVIEILLSKRDEQALRH